MEKYIILFLFSVFVSSVSQIVLKSSANKKCERWIEEYLNVRVIVAYGLFFASSLLTVFAYKYVPLSMGPILEASGYVFVSVLGHYILKEKVGKRKIVGLAVILIGIIIFNIK